MGLKERRKKIEREIEDMIKNAPAHKVRKELNRLLSTLEGQLIILAKAEEAEANIP